MEEHIARPTPNDIIVEALQKAPKTLTGGIGFGITGSVLFGPLGALAGLIIGGILGYCADSTESEC